MEAHRLNNTDTVLTNPIVETNHSVYCQVPQYQLEWYSWRSVLVAGLTLWNSLLPDGIYAHWPVITKDTSHLYRTLLH